MVAEPEFNIHSIFFRRLRIINIKNDLNTYIKIQCHVQSVAGELIIEYLNLSKILDIKRLLSVIIFTEAGIP